MEKKGNIFIIAIVVLAILIFGFGYSFSNFGLDSSSNDAQKEESVVESGNTVPETKEFNMVAKQWKFSPETITVNKGDTVILNIESIDVSHGIAIPDFGVSEFLSPGDTVRIEFVADKQGIFSFFCNVSCGIGHGSMRGTLVVQ